MAAIAEQVELYIDYKRGLGIGFVSQANYLRQFARYTEAIGHEGSIDVELALGWARADSRHTRDYQCQRYEHVRRFSDFCRVFDVTLPVLPKGLLGKAGGRVEPYIYSDEEILLLMDRAGSLGNSPLWQLTSRFLIGLMRATGMRPSEALALKDHDVDEARKTILIKDSKGRSRLIPVTESTLGAITAYKDGRDRIRPHWKRRNLLLAASGDTVRVSRADDFFSECRGILLGHGGDWKRRPPRLMDIRHSFCCWTLIHWHEAGRDVMGLLPMLSHYMGHENIASTYWYLNNVPRLLAIACDAFRGTTVKEVFSDE
jgi:integrase